jgi:6-phosphogluconolactonase
MNKSFLSMILHRLPHCFTIASLFFCISIVPCLAQDRLRVYLGTYTGKSKGIYQCELNLTDGSLTEPILAGETSSPSFLAIHPDKKFMYAVNESDAKISSFAIDPKTGALAFLNSQPSQGGAPCHLIVDPTGRNVLAANYSGGSCLSVPIEADGRLSSSSSFHQHQGPKKNGHSIHLDKANRFALCCDLGLDKVIIYGFDSNTGVLKPHSEFDTPKGSGPRHFAWSIDHKMAFVNGEHNLTLITCEYNADAGTLKQKQVISTLPNDTTRNGGSTAETAVHPNGKFVYVSNRDPYNSIAIFAIHPQSGELSLIGHQAEGIKTPRNFAIEPSGQFMLVANQSGGNVIVFRIDPNTGKLLPTSSKVNLDSPVCVRFMKLES